VPFFFPPPFHFPRTLEFLSPPPLRLPSFPIEGIEARRQAFLALNHELVPPRAFPFPFFPALRTIPFQMAQLPREKVLLSPLFEKSNFPDTPELSQFTSQLPSGMDNLGISKSLDAPRTTGRITSTGFALSKGTSSPCFSPPPLDPPLFFAPPETHFLQASLS